MSAQRLPARLPGLRANGNAVVSRGAVWPAALSAKGNAVPTGASRQQARGFVGPNWPAARTRTCFHLLPKLRAACCDTAERVQFLPEAQNSIVPAQLLVSSLKDAQSAMPVFVELGEEFYVRHRLFQRENLYFTLKILRAAGVQGVIVNVWWGLVEPDKPGMYDWSLYDDIFRSVKEAGLMAQAAFCFHTSSNAGLPRWVMRAAKEDPDMFYSDRAGVRNEECLSLGVDTVPCLSGQTAIQAYGALMRDFAQRFGNLLGSVISTVIIGMGPEGELRYPSCPQDGRWAFPGIGEFQCYDKYMLSVLQACAHTIGQPQWGQGGPHDSGGYCQYPDQTGFFHPLGSWNSAYGRFFLQWYSSMLLEHAMRMLSCASEVFKESNVRLSVKLRCHHWSYHHPSHAAELTAGYFNTDARDGYLPLFKLLSRFGSGAVLCGAASTGHDNAQLQQAADHLLMQLRTAATALQVPVLLSSGLRRPDSESMQELQRLATSVCVVRGVDVSKVQSVAVRYSSTLTSSHERSEAFKAFVKDLKEGLDNNDRQSGRTSVQQSPPEAAKPQQQPAMPLYV